MYPQLGIEAGYSSVVVAPGQTSFTVAQTIFAASDLRIVRAGTLCTYAAIPGGTTQYSLAFAPGVQGVTVTFGGAATGAEKVELFKRIPAKRTSLYPVAQTLSIESLNDELTYLVGVLQSLEGVSYQVDATLRAPFGEILATLPDAANRAGKVQAYDESGQPVLLDQSVLNTPPIGSTESYYDFLKTKLKAGTNVTLGFNDVLKEVTFTVAAGAAYTDENARDAIAAFVTPGNLITTTHDDAANTLTIAVNAAAFTEAVQDVVGAFLNAVSPLSASYDDAGNLLGLTLDQTAVKPVEYLTVPLTDTGVAPAITNSFKLRAPYGMTLTGIRASLATAQTSGSLVTIDVLENGVSVFGANKVTIDNTEKTSTTAATAANLNDTTIADDAEIEIKCTQVGDGTAKGLNVTLLYRRT